VVENRCIERTRVPFAPDSVSVGLYLPASVGAIEAVATMRRVAQIVEAAGFDGAGLAEHHGAAHGNVPSPLQGTTWLLEDTERLWAMPVPILLPLWPAPLMMEQIAWQNARFPGRLGVVFAVGWSPNDFALAGVDLADKYRLFEAGLSYARALRGEADEPLARDLAIQALREHPVPGLAAAGGPIGARRAADAGLGILADSFATDVRAKMMFDRFRAVGGSGPVVLTRRVWVGPVDPGRMDSVALGYEARGTALHNREAIFVQDPDPQAVAATLAESMRVTGAEALVVRFNHPGLSLAGEVEQIKRFGAEVIPALRQLLSASTAGVITGTGPRGGNR
jgi:alkanesulfonate monooxygenase SsuD/methylene tetrahydromethanopterin reductase-like flavin-dependent oxidoreductase (luciferase family)